MHLLFALFWLAIAGLCAGLGFGADLPEPWRQHCRLLAGLALLFSLFNVVRWWLRRLTWKRRDFEAEMAALRARKHTPSEPEA